MTLFQHGWNKKKDLITIGLGFATEFEDIVKGIIVPRSSVTKTKLIMQNSPAQIESDYRGEWIVKFRIINRTIWQQIFGIYPNPIKDDKNAVCQVSFEYINSPELCLTNELAPSQRGEGGFGSTNKK